MCVYVDPSRTETETYVCTMNESLSSRKRVRFEIRAMGVFVSVIGCCQRFVSDAAGAGRHSKTAGTVVAICFVLVCSYCALLLLLLLWVLLHQLAKAARLTV